MQDSRQNYNPEIWFNNSLVAAADVVNSYGYDYFRDIAFSYTTEKLTFKHQDYCYETSPKWNSYVQTCNNTFNQGVTVLDILTFTN